MDPAQAEQRASGVIDRMSVVGFPQQEEFGELHQRHRFFRVYLTGRTTPLGGGPHLAHALAALFPAGLVANAFTRIAESEELDAFRRAYLEACTRAGDRLYGDAPDGGELADRLGALAEVSDLADRPLAAVWADVPTPDGVGARVERAATILREHRGGAHVSVLSSHGLLGPQGLLLTALWREHGEVEGNARSFGWRDDDIAAAWERLGASGLVDGDRALTDEGRAEREAVEDLTDALAAERWAALAPDDRARTVELLEAITPAR